jgi:WD40 repeat protein
MSSNQSRRICGAVILAALAVGEPSRGDTPAATPPPAAAAPANPAPAAATPAPATTNAPPARQVSYFKEVVPVLKKSCTGCHHPGKLKGDLDLTVFAALQKGGKHGAEIKPGNPKESRLVDEISGDDPSMPKEGDPLSKNEVNLIAQWVEQGAKDDTPPEMVNPFKLSKPPEYVRPPVITAMSYSPDGQTLAVSGYHEVLLRKPDGSGIVARLVGESPRIESLAFSPNGKLLATSGGAPSLFGEIEIWDIASGREIHSYKPSLDSLYGLSFSPDSERVAFGGADKVVRELAVADGKNLLEFDNHSDWVLGTVFTVDGKRLLTGSRDKSMKLIDLANGQFIDDINKLLEGELCIARHPKEDIVAYGGDQGTPRAYRIAENQGRTAGDNDVNLVREFERQPEAIRAIAYSPKGDLLAVSGKEGEVRLYKTSDGGRAATLKTGEGFTFALAFNPVKDEIATGGFDGQVRVFDSHSGNLITNYVAVPLAAPAVAQVANAAKP